MMINRMTAGSRAMGDSGTANSPVDSRIYAAIFEEIQVHVHTIRGFLGWMSLQDILEVERQRKAAEAQFNLTRLSGLILNFIVFSGILSGKFEADPATTVIKRLFGEVYEGLAPQVHDKGLVFSMEVDPTLPDTLIQDGEYLAHIVSALVESRLKKPAGGSIRLAFRREEEQLRIEVTDHGSRLAPGTGEPLSMILTREDFNMPDLAEHIGLELYVACGLVEDLDGQFSVSSGLRIGNQIGILLPLNLPLN